MRATGVIVRFLSLLDVALILLGLLMVVLMQAQMRSSRKPGQGAPATLAGLADVRFLYLYAGWQGMENGRCYVLEPNRKLGREVRTDSPDEIRDVLKRRSSGKDRENWVVMLLFSEDGWYSAWDEKRFRDLEQAWKVKIIPVYNVRLSR